MISPEAILNARILVVEDDTISRKLLVNILLSAGFIDVHAIPDAGHVHTIYKQYKPHLVLLDLNLPGIDGFTVMQQLRETYPDDYLPILVISAETDPEVYARALSGGAKDFLNKPYDGAKVVLRCRNIIEVRLLYQELQEKNDDLEVKIAARTKELSDSRLDVIRRLGYAAECRDSDTGQHIVRMSRFCACLARAMGMTGEECELILASAPLHDIGKIAIPDSILLKPGSLTPEEWGVMKTHAWIGGEILSGGDSSFLKMSETIARTHHERWDGAGYPVGLKGKEIPLVGRICSVCDVFDALTSDRPYKNAWSVEAAAVEIRKMSGAHFDPEVVDVFLTILPDVCIIKRDVETQVLRGHTVSGQ